MWQLCTQTPDNAISGGMYGQDADGRADVSLASRNAQTGFHNFTPRGCASDSYVTGWAAMLFLITYKRKLNSEETNQDNEKCKS